MPITLEIEVDKLTVDDITPSTIDEIIKTIPYTTNLGDAIIKLASLAQTPEQFDQVVRLIQTVPPGTPIPTGTVILVPILKALVLSPFSQAFFVMTAHTGMVEKIDPTNVLVSILKHRVDEVINAINLFTCEPFASEPFGLKRVLTTLIQNNSDLELINYCFERNLIEDFDEALEMTFSNHQSGLGLTNLMLQKAREMNKHRQVSEVFNKDLGNIRDLNNLDRIQMMMSAGIGISQTFFS